MLPQIPWESYRPEKQWNRIKNKIKINQHEAQKKAPSKNFKMMQSKTGRNVSPSLKLLHATFFRFHTNLILSSFNFDI